MLFLCLLAHETTTRVAHLPVHKFIMDRLSIEYNNDMSLDNIVRKRKQKKKFDSLLLPEMLFLVDRNSWISSNGTSMSLSHSNFFAVKPSLVSNLKSASTCSYVKYPFARRSALISSLGIVVSLAEETVLDSCPCPLLAVSYFMENLLSLARHPPGFCPPQQNLRRCSANAST